MNFWCEWKKSWTPVCWQDFLAFLSFGTLATLPQTKTVAISVRALQKSLCLYFTLTPLISSPHFYWTYSYLPRLQRTTTEVHKRHGPYMICFVVQLGSKTHVSSSSALSSIVKRHSDTRDSLKVCAVRSCILFQTSNRLCSKPSNRVRMHDSRGRIWHVNPVKNRV